MIGDRLGGIKNLEAMFDVFDVTRDGFITADDSHCMPTAPARLCDSKRDRHIGAQSAVLSVDCPVSPIKRISD